VVAEGRRVIANIERVANLFVTKTVYAMLLAIAVGIARWPYPFLPRHLTIVSSLTIGIPAFFLALQPNTQRYQPGFIRRVLRFTIPCGIVAATATFGAYAYARSAHGVTLTQQRTIATVVLSIVGLGEGGWAELPALGRSLVEAAIEAARLRFRPIIMTSMAFILGVLPLVISTGAGAASQRSIGTGVLGGMLAATFLAIFFVPLFFVLIGKINQWVTGGITAQPPPTPRQLQPEGVASPERVV